jgi:hypothetical protein
MLKTISSITNAIGALNYKGTWNASTNTPTLASGVGTKGDYYVVSVAGSTALDGISNWGVGDLATYNGSVWQRVEGGADLNGVNLSVSGTTTLSGLTASTALALDASKNVVSVTNTGTGDNVLATAPTLVGDVALSTGNLVIGTAGKGIDFSADPSAAGMTSELLDDYEEGAWTPTITPTAGSFTTLSNVVGTYTKVGRQVNLLLNFTISVVGTGTGFISVAGVPFAASGNYAGIGINRTTGVSLVAGIDNGLTTLTILKFDATSPIATATSYAVSLTYFV